MQNYKTITNNGLRDSNGLSNSNSFLNLIAVFSLSLSVSGCAVYNSSFSCGDAKGANCLSMDRVDKMIASGEIERFNESLKECKGPKCSKYESVKSPSLAEKNKQMVVYNAGDKTEADLDNITNHETPTVTTNVSNK